MESMSLSLLGVSRCIKKMRPQFCCGPSVYSPAAALMSLSSVALSSEQALSMYQNQHCNDIVYTKILTPLRFLGDGNPWDHRIDHTYYFLPRIVGKKCA